MQQGESIDLRTIFLHFMVVIIQEEFDLCKRDLKGFSFQLHEAFHFTFKLLKTRLLANDLVSDVELKYPLKSQP